MLILPVETLQRPGRIDSFTCLQEDVYQMVKEEICFDFRVIGSGVGAESRQVARDYHKRHRYARSCYDFMMSIYICDIIV